MIPFSFLESLIIQRVLSYKSSVISFKYMLHSLVQTTIPKSIHLNQVQTLFLNIRWTNYQDYLDLNFLYEMVEKYEKVY